MANETVNRYLNIYIQSGEAEKVLDRLETKEKALNAEIAKGPANVKKLQQELANLQEPLDRARKKVSGELQPSLKETEAAARRVRNELRQMSEGDGGFAKQVQLFQQANAELDGQRQKLGLIKNTMKTFWQEAKTVAVGVVIGNTVQNIMQSVLGYVSGIVTGSAKIADELSDIRKTTGLTKEEIRELNKELGKIDTRTSRTELRQLASEAGKLGIEGVQGIRKFVEDANKIKVALGEDLGEGALTDIAKTSKIFQVEMLNMASAINEVGANSVASETYSVDFLKRMAGVAPTVRLTAQEVLGFSAALEGAGQTQEVAATALNTFMLDFIKGAEGFGKAAGFAKGELTELINSKGTNEAFLTWLQQLKELNPETDKFITKLGEMGIDGARGANVFLALANNIENVRTQQQIANNAIQSSSSIMDEYNEKNNNAAANLEKLKKTVSDFFSSSFFRNIGEGFINVTTSLLQALMRLPATIKENALAFIWLGSVLLALNANAIKVVATIVAKRAALLLETAATKLSAASTAIAAMQDQIYAARKAYLAGQITLATAAQRIWNAVIAANPIGAFIVAITTLVGVMAVFSTRTKELTEAQKLYNATQKNSAEIQAAVSQSVQNTQTKINGLTEVIKSSITTDEQKKKALDQLIAISPDFLAGLTQQNIKHQEGINIINNYIAALGRMAEAQAIANLKTKLLEQKLESQNKTEGLVIEKGQAPERGFFNWGSIGKSMGLGNRDKGDVQDDIEKEQITQADLDRRIKALNTRSATMVKNLQQRIENTKAQLANVKKDSDTAKRLMASVAKDEEAINALLGLGTGTTTDGNAPLATGGTPTTNPRGGGANAMETELKKRAELMKHLHSIYDGYKNKYADFIASLEKDPLTKELNKLDEVYDELREKEKNNADNLLLVNESYYKSLSFIIKKFLKEQQELSIQEIDARAAQNNKVVETLSAKEINIKADETKGVLQSVNQGIDKIKLDQNAAYELKLLRSTGKQRMKLMNSQLEDERLNTLANTNLTENERQLKVEQIDQQIAQNRLDYYANAVSQSMQFLQVGLDIFSSFSQAQTDKENAELEAYRKSNDQKKKILENRLKSGVMTQLEHDRAVAKIEKEQAKREHELAVKQFKRNQRMQIAQTIMSGAQSAINMLATAPWPVNIVMAALAAVATGIQVANIAKQKPPEYGRGGKLRGPSHSENKGMPVVDPRTNRPQAYLEGDEGIINKKTMRDRNVYTLTGTPSQIASGLNAWHGGVNWEGGATMRPVWRMSKPTPMNYSGIRQAYERKPLFAAGGVYNGSSSNNASSQQNTEMMAGMFAQMQANNEMLAQTIANLQKRGIPAYTLLSDQQRQQQRMDNLLNEATMK